MLHYPIQPSIHPFVCPLVHSFVRLSIHSFIRPFTRLFVGSYSVRRCSSLEAPQFGFIYPYMCTSFPVSGTVCYLDCANGFIGNGGVDKMRCEENGKWSSNNSLILQCRGTIFSSSFLRPRCSVSHVWCKRVLATYTEVYFERVEIIYRMLLRVTTLRKRLFPFCHSLKLSGHSPSPPIRR